MIDTADRRKRELCQMSSIMDKLEREKDAAKQQALNLTRQNDKVKLVTEQRVI